MAVRRGGAARVERLALFVTAIAGVAGVAPHGTDEGLSHARAWQLGSLADGYLEEWLRSLNVIIPSIRARKDGIAIQISSGHCTQFQVGDIESSQQGTQVTLRAVDLAAVCEIHWSFRSTIVPLLGAEGDLHAEVSRSSLGGPVAFVSDGGHPPLPATIQATNCQADIQVTDLRFSGSFSARVLQVLTTILGPFIQGLLRRELGSQICKALDDVVGNEGSAALRNASQGFRKFLGTPPNGTWKPEPLPEPTNRFVDFSDNPGVVAVQRLLRVLGNRSSPYNINALVQRYLGAGGNFSLARDGGLFTTFLHLGDLGAMNVTLEALDAEGLDTWSNLGLSTESAHQLGLDFGLDKLRLRLGLKLDVLPAGGGPIHGTVLTERFNLSLGVGGLHLGGKAFLALDESVLATLSMNQLVHFGCFAKAVQQLLVTNASLGMQSITTLLSPVGSGAGELEDAVDRMISMVVNMLLDQYELALQELGNHTLAVDILDKVNRGLVSALASPGPWVDPVPTYINMTVSRISSIVGLSLIALAVALVPVFVLVRWRRLRRARHTEQLDGKPVFPTQAGQSVQPTSGSASTTASTTTPFGTSTTPPAEGNAGVGGTGGPAGTGSVAGTGLVTVSLSDHDAELLRALHSRFPTASAEVQAAEEAEGGWDCLAFHPRVAPAFRWGLPALAVATICMFISSNSSVGTSVNLYLTAGSQAVAHFPSVFDFSLISSVKDMWDGGVYALAWLIIIFSGCWPYIKLLMMLGCWYAPTSVLSTSRRQSFLEFLDAWGKWSLVDAFVMVLFLVAFKFDLAANDPKFPLVRDIFAEAGTSADLKVRVEACFSLHLFVFATMGSLIVGCTMTSLHRYSQKIGEYSPSALATQQHGRYRLCNVLRPPGFLAGKLFVWGPIAAISSSLILVLVGICVDTFQFKFLGMAGFVLGPKDSVRSFSVLSLGMRVPYATLAPNSLPSRWLQGFFLMFSGLSVLAYHAILIVLWCAPLSHRLQTHFFVASQVLNAWSGLDVFVLSICVCILEIERFATYIVGHKCDALNKLLVRLPFADDIPGPKTCFDVDSELKAGFWILLTAAIISGVVGRLMIARCKTALCSTQESEAGHERFWRRCRRRRRAPEPLAAAEPRRL